MKYFLVFFLFFVVCFSDVRMQLTPWYQYVDNSGNPVPENTNVPQVLYPHTINAIPYYPYHRGLKDPIAANKNKILSERNKSKGNTHYSQSDIIGDPYRPCAENEFQCSSPKQCIPIAERCNKLVDCVDVTDEVNCTCVSRLKPEKLCDFYFDCPNGEDELGCFGCVQNKYSCHSNAAEYEYHHKSIECYRSIDICNNIFDCFNDKDERDCFKILKERKSQADPLVTTTENGVLYYLHQDKEMLPVCVDEDRGWSRMVCQKMLPTNNFRDAEIKYEATAYTGKYLSNNFTRLYNNVMEKRKLVQSCPGMDSRNVLLYVNCTSKNPCGLHRAEAEEFSRIAGGFEAISGSNPWLLALFVNGYFRCGGNIYSKTLILTAAHCFFADGKRLSSSDYVEVRAGIRRLFSFSLDQQTVRVMRGFIHENYTRETSENDIALLELESALTLNDLVQPICMPTAERVGTSDDRSWIWGPEPNSVCKTAGWGSHTRYGPSPVDQQLEVHVPIVSTCDPKNVKVICAGYEEGGFDTCAALAFGSCYKLPTRQNTNLKAGDSGGPLVCQSKANKKEVYLAGIVSSSFNPTDKSKKHLCGEKNTYGTYTGVVWYLHWIENIEEEMTKNLMLGIRFLEVCPGVKCASLNSCAFRNGFTDCIDATDELR